MKKIAMSLLFILLTVISYASASDTSGVYINQTDFTNNTLSFKTNHKIRITSRPPFLTTFTVSEEALPIKVKLLNGKKVILSPNNFYGFKTEGAKFIYVNYLNEYLAVLNDTNPLYLFVRKKVHFSGIVAFSDETFYFSKTLNDSLKEFSVENIETSFGNNTLTTQVLMELLKKIKEEGLDIEMHKKQFFRCKKLVEDYLSKLNQNG